ncbi:MAG: hypothetical protein FWG14_05935 [Peptococcaceae bacterium]|nr:hypothetical protein [Peptococcaceae bacterium]
MEQTKIQSIISSLPENKDERIQAILALAGCYSYSDEFYPQDTAQYEQNAEVLAQLIDTEEKRKCKRAAQKALAKLNYKPAGPLWRELANRKDMGEEILMPSCSDCVSDEVAPVVHTLFKTLFALPSGVPINRDQYSQFQAAVSVMLGKATTAMQDVYRLAGTNTGWISQLKRIPDYEGDNVSRWMINEQLSFWSIAPEELPTELAKIFPVVLATSIVRSMDKRLMDLADELHTQYGASWLIPVFMKALTTQTPEVVFDTFSQHLENTNAQLICNVLGMLDYSESKKSTQVWINWGNHGGLIIRPVVLDERWIYRLSDNPKESKPRVTLQGIGTQYHDYDEMLLKLLPNKVEDRTLKQKLTEYFSIRFKFDKEKNKLYQDALRRFV